MIMYFILKELKYIAMASHEHKHTHTPTATPTHTSAHSFADTHRCRLQYREGHLGMTAPRTSAQITFPPHTHKRPHTHTHKTVTLHRHTAGHWRHWSVSLQLNK